MRAILYPSEISGRVAAPPSKAWHTVRSSARRWPKAKAAC